MSNIESLRSDIISCIESNQFSVSDFSQNDIFDMFYEEHSEIAIDRVLYELGTEKKTTPKVVLLQFEVWDKQ